MVSNWGVVSVVRCFGEFIPIRLDFNNPWNAISVDDSSPKNELKNLNVYWIKKP